MSSTAKFGDSTLALGVKSVTLSPNGLYLMASQFDSKIRLFNGISMKEIAALDEKESSLKTSKSLDILATISESFKGAKNFQEGASAFGAKRKTEGLDSDIAALRGIPLDQFKKLQKNFACNYCGYIVYAI